MKLNSSKVFESLSMGAENAKTAKSLGSILGIESRSVSREIRRLRLMGIIILAESWGKIKGYYLPKDEEEIEIYYQKLNKRIKEIQKAVEPIEGYLKNRNFENNSTNQNGGVSNA